MGRFPRVVVVDVPHHVTQRGNARQEKWGMSRLSPNYVPNYVHAEGMAKNLTPETSLSDHHNVTPDRRRIGG